MIIPLNPEILSIRLRTQSHKFKQARCGAEDNPRDQEPGIGAEPFIEEPAEAAECDY